MTDVADFTPVAGNEYTHPDLGRCILRDGQTLTEFVAELFDPAKDDRPLQPPRDLAAEIDALKATIEGQATKIRSLETRTLTNGAL